MPRALIIRRIDPVIEAQRLEGRLEPMQQVKSQQKKTSNIKNHVTTHFELFNHQNSQVMVFLSVINNQWQHRRKS